MLKHYDSPELFVIEFHTEDVLGASDDYMGGEVETPFIPLDIVELY